MSNKSSAPTQVISLPNGGGALHGIGETFAPDLHTGTGNFTVPIALPGGRNGFQPQLNLVYSTGNGNGPFGLGWGLSIPGVSRKTSRGIPRYGDERGPLSERDTFLLSGRFSVGNLPRPKTRSGISSATTMNASQAIPPTIFGTNFISSKYVTLTTTMRKPAAKNF